MIYIMEKLLLLIFASKCWLVVSLDAWESLIYSPIHSTVQDTNYLKELLGIYHQFIVYFLIELEGMSLGCC